MSSNCHLRLLVLEDEDEDEDGDEDGAGHARAVPVRSNRGLLGLADPGGSKGR
jgi:hypothetical protein